MSDTNEIVSILEKLRTGELEQITVSKEEFSSFREVLVQQKDKEKFRGEAKKGCEVIYTYQIDAS